MLTAKRLEGTRNSKVVASSEGRKEEAMRPTGFTGLPRPTRSLVSSWRSVTRRKKYGPSPSLRCCSVKVWRMFRMAVSQVSSKTEVSPVVFQ